MSEQGPVAIVTGASGGEGRGIAIALGSHGCTVYVTGRSEKAGDHPLPGAIFETAEAVTAAGGRNMIQASSRAASCVRPAGLGAGGASEPR